MNNKQYNNIINKAYNIENEKIELLKIKGIKVDEWILTFKIHKTNFKFIKNYSKLLFNEIKDILNIPIYYHGTNLFVTSNDFLEYNLKKNLTPSKIYDTI